MLCHDETVLLSQQNPSRGTKIDGDQAYIILSNTLRNQQELSYAGVDAHTHPKQTPCHSLAP